MRDLGHPQFVFEYQNHMVTVAGSIQGLRGLETCARGQQPFLQRAMMASWRRWRTELGSS
jgi:hypothetical protein